MNKEVTDAGVSPHDILITVDLKQEHIVRQFLIVLPWIRLCKKGIPAQPVAGEKVVQFQIVQ